MTQKTEYLDATESGIERAIKRAGDVLRSGGLVAFPTETVYGLGADAGNDAAVAQIFEAKARPQFNPLIVHVASLEAAQALADFPDAALRLAQAFWPGPLTLVVPMKPGAPLSKLVSAGLPTVGLRVPDAPLAQALFEAAGCPVAAPSANPSGKISPTQAAHVAQGLDGRIDAILDGGACGVGVESTIVGFDGETPVLLRPGGLPAEALEAAIGAPLRLGGSSPDAPSSPGQLESHYAPGAPVRLNAQEKRAGEVLLGFGAVEGADLNLSPAGDLLEAAANLFAMLHELDGAEAEAIAVSPIPETGLGRAINDRLRRAAAPRG
ncbi:L-threonylcarbamoyladenylate synthase [Pseudoruegeria sp. SHC-113]|uniref:L-threonylcarbamoyladenylate synthase n=1 Tax=Pseudoruegeria sp. SHC-113 TaxID=2855439 RepID=UPI0021BB69C4|nr:L-threonylcarbamoyladenylate synthase [Pseudoruegeria sp. SHC-113]MCT8158922.1 threonylcarbamoyl-AMP synthase [Pseudoruegeria sp. SHC-113]